MRRAPKETPVALRHVIRPAGDGFELVTWKGYVLKAFETRADAEAYYACHCGGPEPI